MSPNPLAKGWLRHYATRGGAQPHIKLCPPLANPAYAHGLQLRNLFEEMLS